MPRRPTSILCALAALLGISVPGCEQSQARAAQSQAAPAPVGADGFPAGPYADRDARLAKQLVDAGALLLDVRSAGEFADAHLDGAVHITHTQIGARLDEIRELQGQDPHKPIVLYCRSGHRASLAKRELEAAGFDRVTNLGGISDWVD